MQNQQISEKIKKLCKDNNVTIKKMLEDCKINRNFIYGLEKANKTPSSETLKKISNFFNVPIDYFYNKEDGLKEYRGQLINALKQRQDADLLVNGDEITELGLDFVIEAISQYKKNKEGKEL